MIRADALPKTRRQSGRRSGGGRRTNSDSDQQRTTDTAAANGSNRHRHALLRSATCWESHLCAAASFMFIFISGRPMTNEHLQSCVREKERTGPTRLRPHNQPNRELDETKSNPAKVNN